MKFVQTCKHDQSHRQCSTLVKLLFLSFKQHLNVNKLERMYVEGMMKKNKIVSCYSCVCHIDISRTRCLLKTELIC